VELHQLMFGFFPTCRGSQTCKARNHEREQCG
jgi:hypothetical protein